MEQLKDFLSSVFDARHQRINRIGNSLVDAAKVLLLEVTDFKPTHVPEQEWKDFEEKRQESLETIFDHLVAEEEASDKEWKDVKFLLETTATTQPEGRRLRMNKFGGLIREAYTINLEGLKSFKTMGDRESGKVTLACFEKMLANISKMDEILLEEMEEMDKELE
jgi:hypothetical protein